MLLPVLFVIIIINMWANSQQRGFTIVELLIVIVIIAILAAITVVAYNGITQRAQQSAAQSLANQALKAISVYAATNDGTYPADLASANLTSPDLQYTVNNAATPKTFCLTATNGTQSYFVSDSQSTPQAGGCAGHGQGGQAPVTNLVKMPAPLTGDYGAWTQYNSAGGYTMTNNANANGSRNAWRMTLGAAGMPGGNSATIGYEYQGTGIQVTAGTTVYPSIHVRANKAGNYSIWCTFWNVTTSTGSCPQTVVAVSANTWTRLGGTAVTVPASSDRMTIRVAYISGTTWAAGDWWEATMASTAPGAYADGNTTNWVWNGTVGKSTSTGPQQ